MTPKVTLRPPLPELLAPAGSPEALEAALSAGADAVYLGSSRFNARMNAHNFDRERLTEAVTHAHRMGGRVYLTLNTLLWDRELSEALETAYQAATVGVDALIVADLGIAALLRSALPELPLHASTQLSGHNAAIGEVLQGLGFSRYVIAREARLSDLVAAVRDNPLEVEVFIHGALCVSHSGQCLFSSLVGGRSGNRGECAQPCRLPYGETCPRGASAKGCPSHKAGSAPSKGGRGRPCAPSEKEEYPLSLKDLSLAEHLPSLIEAGVSSLKIEGRMKSPGYVGGVTGIWRRLLDERRAATPEEMTALQELFSRGGFTDGYQVGRVDASMMGIRSEEDKEKTAAAEKAALHLRYPPRLPLTLSLTARGEQPLSLTASAPLFRCHNPRPPLEVTVTAPPPETTQNTPLTSEAAQKQLSRTGGTPYEVTSLSTHLDEGLFLPLSRLNALRREALTALDNARMTAMPTPAQGYHPVSAAAVIKALLPPPHEKVSEKHPPRHTARFHDPSQIPPSAVSFFDCLYLPLGKPHPSHIPLEKRGLLMPPVILDHERESVFQSLTEAIRDGVRQVMVSNSGQLPLLRQVLSSLTPKEPVYLHGDLRLNITNTLAAAGLLSLGLTDLLLSPELTIPRMRDISATLEEQGRPGVTAAVVYGRLPLMLLEKCAIRELYRRKSPRDVCRDICAQNAARLKDRMGKTFPVLREALPDGTGHRNVVYNSLPTGMSDRMGDLSRALLGTHHFLFTVETSALVEQVIAAYREETPLPEEVRRIAK